MGLIRSCFARTQTWLQAGKYLNALVSDRVQFGLPGVRRGAVMRQCRAQRRLAEPLGGDPLLVGLGPGTTRTARPGHGAAASR
jgi:hypothetical protein